MTDRTQVRVVFFDAAGTLFHLPRGVAWHYRDVARRHGLMLDKDDLARAFRAAWEQMPPPLVTRVPRADDDRGWWRDLVNLVLDACAVPRAGFDRDAYFEELYAEFSLPGVWELYPEVQEVLTRLSNGFRLGVISNFDGRLRAILQHLDIATYFQHITISSEVGADKPDAWIFHRALALSGAVAEEALHAGDDPACDWEGGSAAGLHTFHLDRPRNSLLDLLALLQPPD